MSTCSLLKNNLLMALKTLIKYKYKKREWRQSSQDGEWEGATFISCFFIRHKVPLPLSPGNPVLSFISTAERLEQVASETRPLNKWRFPFTCSSQLKSISGFSRCQHSFVYVGCVNGYKVNAAFSIQAACEVPVFNRLCPWGKVVFSFMFKFQLFTSCVESPECW